MAPSHILIFKQKIMASYTPIFTSLSKKVQHELVYLSSLQSYAFQGLYSLDFSDLVLRYKVCSVCGKLHLPRA